MRLIVRDFNPIKDSGFIFSTYPKGIYYGLAKEPKGPKSKWFADYYQKTKDLIQTATIRVASPEDDPNTIFGYSIVNNAILEFVYVKEIHRRQGIAALLVPNNINDYNNITKIAQIILDHRLKGESHGSTDNRQGAEAIKKET